MRNLKLHFDEWDYNGTKPQSTKYKQWLKAHLVQGHPVVWFVMCKGDDACPYPHVSRVAPDRLAKYKLSKLRAVGDMSQAACLLAWATRAPHNQKEPPLSHRGMPCL